MINQSRLTRLTQKLIRFNSENPPGNELEIARFIEKDMRSLGLQVKIYTFAFKRPNIVATLKGSGNKESILLTPHIDTVPAGAGWKFNPWGGVVKGGRIYGRGASDDKGNLASCMEVMRSLVEDKIRLKKDIIFAATADEETGSHRGIVPLLKKSILRPTVALVMDSDEFDTIVAQKGLIHFRIKIFGKKAHGAYNWRGINAIEQAAQIIGKLKKHKFKFKKHPLLRPPTLNIGTVKGGDKVNVVADFCEFSIDTRYLPGTNPKAVLKDVEKIIRSVTKKFKIEIDDLQYPYEIDPKHPMVGAYLKAAKRMNIKAYLKGSEGATVITFFQDKGIPAVATGYGTHGVAHITDEYIKIDTLYRGTKLLEQFLKDYDKL